MTMNFPTPFRAMNQLQRQMDRLFDEAQTFLQPACDVDETDTQILMSFDLPGMKKEDIKIEYEGNILRVSGERKDERHDSKAIERVFTLPQAVKAEQIEAHFDNGVLHVAIQKAEAPKPRQIPIAEKVA
jgi:HSP20 family protein